MASDWLQVVLFDNRYFNLPKSHLTTVGHLKEWLLPQLGCVCHAAHEIKVCYGEDELHDAYDLTWPDRVHAWLAAEPCIHEKNAALLNKPP